VVVEAPNPYRDPRHLEAAGHDIDDALADIEARAPGADERWRGALLALLPAVLFLRGYDLAKAEDRATVSLAMLLEATPRAQRSNQG